MLWLHMRVRICKKPFVDVVVLCSGNKKQTKKQERGIPLSSPSRVLECRVFLAGCSYSLAMHELLISYAPAINKNNKKRNATQRNGAGARKRLRFKRCIPSCCGAILHSTRSAGNRPLLGKPLQVFETRVDLESTSQLPCTSITDFVAAEVQAGKTGVDLEGISQLPCTSIIDVVALEVQAGKTILGGQK